VCGQGCTYGDHVLASLSSDDDCHHTTGDAENHFFGRSTTHSPKQTAGQVGGDELMMSSNKYDDEFNELDYSTRRVLRGRRVCPERVPPIQTVRQVPRHDHEGMSRQTVPRPSARYSPADP